MVLKEDQLKVKALVQDTIRLLVKSGLTYRLDIGIQGVIGVTVDGDDVFLIGLNETIQSDISQSVDSSRAGDDSKLTHLEVDSQSPISENKQRNSTIHRKKRKGSSFQQEEGRGFHGGSVSQSPRGVQDTGGQWAEEDQGIRSGTPQGEATDKHSKRRRYTEREDEVKNEAVPICYTDEDFEAIIIKEEPKTEGEHRACAMGLPQGEPFPEADRTLLQHLASQVRDPSHVDSNSYDADSLQTQYPWPHSSMASPESQKMDPATGQMSATPTGQQPFGGDNAQQDDAVTTISNLEEVRDKWSLCISAGTVDKAGALAKYFIRQHFALLPEKDTPSTNLPTTASTSVPLATASTVSWEDPVHIVKIAKVLKAGATLDASTCARWKYLPYTLGPSGKRTFTVAAATQWLDGVAALGLGDTSRSMWKDASNRCHQKIVFTRKPFHELTAELQDRVLAMHIKDYPPRTVNVDSLVQPPR